MPERTHFDSLDEAMAALGVPLESRSLPAKSPYIAVRPLGERVIKTYVNRTFIDQWLAPTRYERTHTVGGIADGPHAR
ncbi:hypothetical protein [Cellulomonas xiejunii]|uniref:hypothetical protein n=1 Tax=Cellulomonas xiejunii TaxID=2968083 RepID=UPI001D0DD521|nr:hypothetical protein [Cellulomonas xiejunii]MCC2321360.1 hypothetical protein [Cellulomonas xiejunii]